MKFSYSTYLFNTYTCNIIKDVYLSSRRWRQHLHVFVVNRYVEYENDYLININFNIMVIYIHIYIYIYLTFNSLHIIHSSFIHSQKTRNFAILFKSTTNCLYTCEYNRFGKRGSERNPLLKGL